MGHQELYHPRGRIERIFLRSLLVLALLGQVCGGYVELQQAVFSCLREVPTGEQCCSSGAANCGSFRKTDMPDWDVSNILNMKMLFGVYGDAFNQDISRWNVSQVQNMVYMFHGAPTFDADITSWDTSSLVASQNMFFQATAWHAKFERKKNVGGGPLDGPPSAWQRKDLQRKDLPPLLPSPLGMTRRQLLLMLGRLFSSPSSCSL
jgi:hypothetical protein